MPVLQNLYQVYKISSTTLVENEFKIEQYTKKQAMRDGNLVSIGDNLLFYKIRDYYGDKRSHEEIFYKIRELRKTSKLCKLNGEYDGAKVVEQQISDILFVKDVIVVTCEKKKDYSPLVNGFVVNGIKFKRLLAGAGNLRRNCAIYVNEELWDYLFEVFMCGLKDRMKEAVLSKLGAYFALSFSSVLWVRTPRVCVIKDFENVVPQQKVDFICRDGERHYIEEKVMDLTLNCADGQGLIDPAFSELWAQDMHLDYVPSSFVARSCFVKGNFVPFDFKEYARENGISTIKDKWGVEYNVDDIDVLLSESQFKMHKEYKNWQEYLEYFNKYGLRWGVARYNKKYDDEYVLANYQYIQALDLTKDDVKELIKPTVEWFQKICSGDDLYSMLFMFGSKRDDVDYERMYSSAQSNFMKAIIKNKDFLKDSYVQKKIYKNIVECLNRAKIGKIWVKGNYQFAISDPIAQCRSALGLKPDGEIPADCIYSNFWNERGREGIIDVCRSPQIDQHEHNPSTLYKSDIATKWYNHINSGVIFSIYDTATFRLSDSDYDGDIVFTTDNIYFINGSHKSQNIITYEKGMAKKEKISVSNFIKKDLLGFGTAVGSFSNTATVLYSMIGIFNKPEQEPQRQELRQRIKLLREYVGQEIDRAKLGIKKPQLPAAWKKFEKINQDDTDAVKADKYKHNSLVVSKKPYFFRYLYPELNKKYKLYENSYNVLSKDMFGIKFKKLLAKTNKTEAEKMLVRRYQKYSPLIVSDCTMNVLCKEFENIDFDIKYNKSGACNMLPLFEYEYECDVKILSIFRDAYRKYNNKKSVKTLCSVFGDKCDDDIERLYFNVKDVERAEIKEMLFSLMLKPEEMLFYVGQLSKEYTKFNWGFVWDIMDDVIIYCIPQGQTIAPIRTEDGEEYLGQTYTLKTISKNSRNGEIKAEDEIDWDFDWDLGDAEDELI